MRKILIGLLVWTVVPAYATLAPNRTTEAFVRTLVRMPMTEKNMLFISALGGANSSELRSLSRDFRRAGIRETPIAAELKGDELWIGGRATGLVFQSYSPCVIKFGSQSWTYDKSKTVFANSAELKKRYLAFKTGRASALWNLWLPEARAQTLEDAGEYWAQMAGTAGSWLGGVAGGASAYYMGLGWASVAGEFLGAKLGTLLGPPVGNTAGQWAFYLQKGQGVPRYELVDFIVKAAPKFTCTRKEMQLAPSDGSGVPSISVKRNKGQPAVRLVDMLGVDVSDQVTESQESLLAELAGRCADHETAERLQNLMRTSASQVIEAVAQKDQSAVDKVLGPKGQR